MGQVPEFIGETIKKTVMMTKKRHVSLELATGEQVSRVRHLRRPALKQGRKGGPEQDICHSESKALDTGLAVLLSAYHTGSTHC